MKTQAERIVDYMREFGSITQIEALQDLGCMRLASRISDLRRGGVPVVSEMVAVKNRWGEAVRVARYRLEEEQKDENHIRDAKRQGRLHGGAA